MKWRKPLGFFIIILSLEPAYTGNEQSLTGKGGKGKERSEYAQINAKETDYLDYTEQTFFDKEVLHNAFSEIVKRNIDEGEKLKLMSDVYSKAKHLIETPEDYIKLLKATANETSEPAAKISAAGFIRSDLDTFKAFEPSIDEVMMLHSYILKIQTDVEQTVATLIKLKQVFIKDFQDSDLIRLLGYGCENPCVQYIEQLAALKRLHKINF